MTSNKANWAIPVSHAHQRRSRCCVLLGQSMAVFIAAAASLGGGCATHMERELAVPNVRQSTGYTCSAAALQAVLAYFGIETREDRLTHELRATPELGAPPESIMRVAQSHGLTAVLREQLTVAELQQALRAGSPVLVDFQAWPERRPGSFRNDWEDGHYAVVVAIEGDTIVLEDPSLLGSRGVLPLTEFQERWHDTDGKRRYIHAGIIFGGRTPAPPPPRRPVQ
jgi:predicted double-glycine peptidase